MMRAAPAAALALVLASPAFAQTGQRRSPDTEIVPPLPPAPAGRIEATRRGVSLELEVEGEESLASAQISDVIKRMQVQDGQGNVKSGRLSYSLKASVPIGGSDDLTSNAALDALRNGPKLTFSLDFLSFRSADLESPAFVQLWPEAIEACRRAAGADPEKQRDCDANEAFRTPQKAYEYMPRRRAEINRSLFSTFWRGGADASLGVNRFKFVDPATLKEADQTKIQFSAGAFAAIYPADALSSWTGRVEYQNAYEADEESVVCRPIVADPADDCVVAASAAPKNVERLNFSLEHRRILGPIGPGSLAISPRATYDALSDEFGAELPIYYALDGDVPISPGVTIGYSSEKDEFEVGLFLKTGFSFD